MRHADNENDQLSFITLAASTANVTRWLTNKQKQNPEQGDEPSAREDEKAVPDSQEDIERRIRDIMAMENRLRRHRI